MVIIFPEARTMQFTSRQQAEIKDSLCSMVACEIRAVLYEALSKELGTSRTISMLSHAEKRALSSIARVRLSSLMD